MKVSVNTLAKVSVVIPVYNVEKYLVPCLESVIHQTLEDIEIICIDDGSTDSSGKILDEYASKDYRIRVIHKENGGYGKAMNLGLDYATGEYFAIFESDDMIRPQMYERLYNLAKKYDVDVIKADFCRFVVNNGVIEETSDTCVSDKEMYGHVLDGEKDIKDILMKAPLYTWSGIYSIDYLRKNNIRHNETPGASYQDNGFWFQTMSCAKRIYFLNEEFYMLRRDNPNSSFLSKGKVYCVRDEYEFILNFLKERPETYNKVIALYWPIRFGAYMFTYRRIAPDYKLEFLNHTKEVFLQAKNDNQLVQKEFSKSKWKILNEILKSPENYHRRHQIEENKNGRLIKLWNRFLWCYQDNGLRYTVFHLLSRIKDKFGLKKNNYIKEIRTVNSMMERQGEKLKEIERQIVKIEETIERNKRSNIEIQLLQELKKQENQIHSTAQELIFSNIFNQTIHDSLWLKNITFSPGRAAVGYNYLYVTYRCLNEFKPKTILDIGLGQSTKLITQYVEKSHDAHHIVVEHDREWINFFENSNSLSERTIIKQTDIDYTNFKGDSVRVYQDFEKIIKGKRFDFISIDAPISYDMSEYARIDIIPFLPSCLKEDFIIILDDYQRIAEKHSADEIRNQLIKYQIPFSEGVYRGQTDIWVICSENLKFFTSL